MMAVRTWVLALLIALALGGVARAQSTGPWFGTDVRDLTRAEADKLGWDAPRGALVTKAPERGSPADKAGLAPGDIIIAVDRLLIDTAAEFTIAIAAKRPGNELRLQVLSAGRERRVAVALAERPRQPISGDGTVPQLMLDTGGHMGLIESLAFTADGRFIVSAGDDKVIRVWDWQAGKTVRTIRGQAGAGLDGQVYAMALSPDGRWLAAGGYSDGNAIRLYDFASGKLAALLAGHKNVVSALAFSADSTRLISGGGDAAAIIWDIDSRKLLHRLTGHKDHIYAVGFTADGARAVTGSTDTTLKLWSVRDGKELAALIGHKQKVYRLSISPADGIIASASDDGEIRLWDDRTGRFLRVLGNQGAVAGALVFSPDGRKLVSTCGGGSCAGQPQIVWEVATGRRLQQPRHHDNVVAAAAISPDGNLVATGGGINHEIRVWNLDSNSMRKVLAGIGTTTYAGGFAQDGRRIAWGSTDAGSANAQKNPYEFSLRLPEAGTHLGVPELLGGEAASGILRARAVSGAYMLAPRKAGPYGHNAVLDVARGGRIIASIERDHASGYGHWAYSFSPDGQTIVSGGAHGFLADYDLKGQLIGRFIGHEGVVLAVTPSADGRLLISGSDDQTTRLWNIKSHELIATLFRGTDGEWVMWTPQGYYTGSPGSDKLVGWQINRGPENAADYVGADQLRRHLNRPDVVERAIILASAEQAVRESPGTVFQLADLLKRPLPRFRIVSPESGATERGGRTLIRISAEAVADPITYIRVQVNGRQVDETNPPIGSGGLEAGERLLDVPLAKGRNEVRITLGNTVGEKAETVALLHEGDGDLDKRGTLYILAVGVDRYPGLGNTCGETGTASCDLRFSGADARKLADAAENRLGPAHAKVVKRVLVNGAGTNDAPTASNILDAIDVLKQARETDTVLMFIAGHGANDGSSYRFLATNAERAGDTFRSATVVPWQFLQDAIETTKGRRILFIDTCHSGNGYNQQLGNAAYHANIIAYTAARFDQEALEDGRLGHGLFTYAVVEGLEGKSDPGAKREISTRDLADYVVKRVDQLAKALKGEQEPQYFTGRDAEDYVLAKW